MTVESAFAYGGNIWVTDGTAAGTKEILAAPSGYYAYSLFSFNSGFLFWTNPTFVTSVRLKSE